MTYQDAMTAGEQAAARGDYEQALRYFGTAHGLGHDILRQHLAAHAAMIGVSWRARHPVRTVTQIALWLAACLFDRSPGSQKSPEATHA